MLGSEDIRGQLEASHWAGRAGYGRGRCIRAWEAAARQFGAANWGAHAPAIAHCSRPCKASLAASYTVATARWVQLIRFEAATLCVCGHGGRDMTMRRRTAPLRGQSIERQSISRLAIDSSDIAESLGGAEEARLGARGAFGREWTGRAAPGCSLRSKTPFPQETARLRVDRRVLGCSQNRGLPWRIP